MNQIRSAVILPVLFAGLLLAGCYSSAPTQNDVRPLTSDVTLSEEDIESIPSAVNIQQLLRGRTSGVYVRQTGSGFSVQIRGEGSINMSTEPLYILDGTPLTTSGGQVTSVNPRDISSIEVIKGPEAARYGVQGANGVVLIETKRASNRE